MEDDITGEASPLPLYSLCNQKKVGVGSHGKKLPISLFKQRRDKHTGQTSSSGYFSYYRWNTMSILLRLWGQHWEIIWSSGPTDGPPDSTWVLTTV